MSSTPRESEALVLEAAVAIAQTLYEIEEDLPRVSFWRELEAEPTNSGGWSVEIATVGNSSPRLEVWIDKYAGANGERFYAGLSAGTSAAIQPFIDAGEASRRWKPATTITSQDLRSRGRYTRLARPLDDAVYGHAIVEHLNTREHFFGVYDAIEPRDPLAHKRFCRLAEDFFSSVLTQKHAGQDALYVAEDDYPAVERKLVRRHLRFERNSRLASQRKRMDHYTCAVCDLFMPGQYGELAREYAEAHHKVPLHRLKKTTSTAIDDLLTVCPNCHRILHRMDGKEDDWVHLRRMVELQRER